MSRLLLRRHGDESNTEALLESGKGNVERLVTHVFSLGDFNRAVAVQGDPAAGALKVIINP